MGQHKISLNGRRLYARCTLKYLKLFFLALSAKKKHRLSEGHNAPAKKRRATKNLRYVREWEGEILIYIESLWKKMRSIHVSMKLEATLWNGANAHQQWHQEPDNHNILKLWPEQKILVWLRPNRILLRKIILKIESVINSDTRRKNKWKI